MICHKLTSLESSCRCARKLAGKVYLVGAGPGDPGLITVKGLKCLKQAQVVVYDRLLDPALLQVAPESAERISVVRG